MSVSDTGSEKINKTGCIIIRACFGLGEYADANVCMHCKGALLLYILQNLEVYFQDLAVNNSSVHYFNVLTS